MRRFMNEVATLCEAEADSPIIAYHGTLKQFTRFDPQFHGTANDAGYFGKGFYFSTDFGVAAGYCGQDAGKGQVLKCRLTLRNPYRMHIENKYDYASATMPSTAKLIELGFDSVIAQHHLTDSTEIMVLHAASIDILDVIDPDLPDWGVHNQAGSADQMRDMMLRHREANLNRSKERSR